MGMRWPSAATTSSTPPGAISGITAIVVNNAIYGMTGGQYSPTTPLNGRATTAPYGNIEPPFPICDLAVAAGASYVARSTVYHALELDKFISEAIAKDGFSVVEAVSYCHTTYGRLNKLGTAADMMRALKDNSISQSCLWTAFPGRTGQQYEDRARQLHQHRPSAVYGGLFQPDHARPGRCRNDRRSWHPAPRSGWQGKAGRA